TFASGGGAPTRPAAMPAIRPDSPLNHPPAEGRPAERNRLDAATRGESCWPWSETENVLTRWLTQGTLPAAARETGAIPFNESAWLMALLLRDPRLFAQCVRPLYSRPAVKTRLLNQLSLGVVAQALAQSDVSAAVSIPTIPALRTLLLRLALPAVSQAVRQQSLLACLLDAWLRPVKVAQHRLDHRFRQFPRHAGQPPRLSLPHLKRRQQCHRRGTQRRGQRRHQPLQIGQGHAAIPGQCGNQPPAQLA
ncbi:hypothetical protein, partial [Dickeya dianthicola]|uniref:hypothetical protein n=1 Tax=Dickeya dianthicola TaxID=204039 RepID=UPI0018DF5E48